MRRLILAFAGYTYHIVGNLMVWLICFCVVYGTGPSPFPPPPPPPPPTHTHTHKHWFQMCLLIRAQPVGSDIRWTCSSEHLIFPSCPATLQLYVFGTPLKSLNLYRFTFRLFCKDLLLKTVGFQFCWLMSITSWLCHIGWTCSSQHFMFPSQHTMPQLHVFGTPLKSLNLYCFTLSLFCKDLFLESVRPIHTVPSVARHDMKSVRGWGWTFVLWFFWNRWHNHIHL